MSRTHAQSTRMSWLVLLAAFAVSLTALACESSSSDGDDDDDTSLDGDTDTGTPCTCPEGCAEDGTCLVNTCEDSSDCPPGLVCGPTGLCVRLGILDGDEEWDDSIDPTDGDDDPMEDGDTELDIETSTLPRDESNPWLESNLYLVDFGAVPLGSSMPKEIRISNAGEADLVIDDIHYYYEQNEEDPEFTLASEGNFTLVSGASQILTLVFEPKDLTPDEDYLVIHSNDPSSPDTLIRVISNVKESRRVEIRPDTLNFGMVRLGAHEEIVEIENLSGLDVTVVRLELLSETGEFSLGEGLDDVSQDNPILLSGRRTRNIPVIYDPQAADGIEDSAELFIETDAENIGTVQIHISGSSCEPEIDVLPNAIDFSDAPHGFAYTDCDTTVTNLGCMPLEIESLSITNDAGGVYSWNPAPDVSDSLGQDESFNLCVQYESDGSGSDQGTITIVSNDADEAELEIPLSGNPIPGDLECTPDTLHYEPVTPGNSVILQVECRNVGAGTIVIDDYEVTSASGVNGPFFFLANTPSEVLTTGQRTYIRVAYRPTLAQQDLGSLSIVSNDPDEGTITIDLIGDGVDTNTCPRAVIDLISPAAEDIEPLDTVRLSAASSTDPDNDAITRYRWTLLTAPSGSTSLFTSFTSETTSLFLDLAGTYRVGLDVWDERGAQNCNPVEFSFEAIPGESIHVQLIWDTNDTDLDLHLVKPSGSIWDTSGAEPPTSDTGSDCYYSNCVPEEGYENPVDWSDCGHPSLDIDDRNGLGPENINLDDPCDSFSGDYYVYVHFWDSRTQTQPTTATVRIYIMGLFEREYQMTLNEEHLLWDVAHIRWNNNTALVFDGNGLLGVDPHGQ